MPRKPKFYIGRIIETIGEYEVYSTFRFATAGSPDRKLDAIAKDWYGKPCNKDSGTYYFNGGEVAVCAGPSQEISEETFNAVSLLTNMS